MSGVSIGRGASARDQLVRIISEKTAVTDGAIQTGDQVIGSLSIPAGSLNINDVFRVLVTFGRDNSTDAYGTTTFRMGTAGSTADSSASSVGMSGTFPGAGGALSTGYELWWRVVSVGTNSVIEKLGTANGTPSFSGASATATAIATQYTLTGYNLATQAGFFTVTTTMGAATATKPRTGYMRLEIV